MSDERRQNSTVNLQELERQLREAARARQRAQASVDTLTGVQPERPPVPVAQNPVPQPSPSSYQPGLPLSAPQAPAPQPAPQQSFRPLTQPTPAPVPQSSSPSMPQASSYLSQPPVQPRESQQSFAPLSADPRERTTAYTPPAFAPAPAYTPPPPAPQPTYEARSDEAFDDDMALLKTDQMGDVYPAVETGSAEAVGQNQYYSAAAYEEPAATAYDRYTEDQFPPIEQEERSSGFARIAVWAVIIAILGAGGYFAYPLLQNVFMPASQTAKAPPLIKADPNPVKVEPETQPQADNAGVPKDIFTKHANEDPKSAQIAPGAEQPADLTAAAKAGSASVDAGSKAAIVPLVPGTGEPRLVKTVTVRADGSIIPEKSDPGLTAKTVPAGPKLITIAPSAPAAPAVPTPVEPSIPAKPVSQSPDFVLDGPIPLPPERVSVVEPEMTLPLDAITTPLPATTQPEPVAAAAPVAAPAPVASAPVAAAGKDFAVQFGAPETEAKGNELKARVEKQFASALTGGTVAVVKGESNGKPVFRVRAINYTREEANAVCQQVAAAGGQCFVSKNN